jgi:quinol monooxygenase YgiN
LWAVVVPTDRCTDANFALISIAYRTTKPEVNIVAFHLLATFTARPGREGELAEALAAMVEPTLTEPGCLAYEALFSPQRHGRVVMVEEWESLDALRQHVSTPYFLSLASRFDELLENPPGLIELNRTSDSQFAKLGLEI